MQLLQMKIQITIVVQQLRMQLIDEMRRLLDASALHSIPDEDSIIEGVQLNGRLDSGLGLELFGGLLEAL